MHHPTSPPPTATEFESADEAFALLSDSTRIEILRSIWTATDPFNPGAIPFSEIRELADVDDPGRLNYHLNKLTGRFIRRTSDGYALRESGRRILRVLVSGTAIADPSVGPVEIDADCVFCGAPVELTYEDGWRYLECTECDARCVDSYPDGVLSRHELPPSGVLRRTADEIHEADLIWSEHRRASVIDGICPDCAGPMPVESFELCEDHRPGRDHESVCEHCGSIFWTEVVSMCEICRSVWKMPIQFHLATHPEVVAFYHEHGVDFHLAAYEYRSHLLTFMETKRSDDPLRIEVTIPYEGDELRIVIDERVNVVEVEAVT